MTRAGGGEGMPEFPLLTITKLPPGFLVHLGGMVGSMLLAASYLVSAGQRQVGEAARGTG